MARLLNPLIYVKKDLTYTRYQAIGSKALLKYLRHCASNYIKRKEVRQFVLERDNHQCIICHCTEGLQVDHKVSVYRGWKENIPIEEINSVKNLQTLCIKCNAGKRV